MFLPKRSAEGSKGYGTIQKHTVQTGKFYIIDQLSARFFFILTSCVLSARCYQCQSMRTLIAKTWKCDTERAAL